MCVAKFLNTAAYSKFSDLITASAASFSMLPFPFSSVKYKNGLRRYEHGKGEVAFLGEQNVNFERKSKSKTKIGLLLSTWIIRKAVMKDIVV